MDVDEVIAVVGILLCTYLLKNTSGRQSRRFKTRPINRRRRTHGFFQAYFLPMKQKDENQFFKYTRMSVTAFNELLRMLTPYLGKSRRLPDSIGPDERLAVTLHFFSQGCSMQAVAWTYHMGHSTVHKIIIETANAIWNALSEVYLKPPSSENKWIKIAKEFEDQWNFPNCVGALDGKHIHIQAPAKSGSQYFNYKKTFSIVLLAACDANYNFTLVDIGAYGSESDGSIFKNSLFGNMLDKGEMHIPRAKKLLNSDIVQPFVFLADEAFPLKTYIMRPYPGRNLSDARRIFNYRLSRARRCIENAFGILVNRWRLLRNMIVADVNNIDIFVKAILCLHNYVKSKAEDSYCPPGFTDSDDQRGTWRDEVQPLNSVGRLSANRATALLYTARDKLRDYFLSNAGQIPWQKKVLEDGML